MHFFTNIAIPTIFTIVILSMAYAVYETNKMNKK